MRFFVFQLTIDKRSMLAVISWREYYYYNEIVHVVQQNSKKEKKKKKKQPIGPKQSISS